MSGKHFTVLDPSAKVVAARGERVVVELAWRESTDGVPLSLFQVLTFRNDKIVDMVDRPTKRDALRSARLS